MKFKNISLIPAIILLFVVGSAVWNLNKNWDNFTTPPCTYIAPTTPEEPKEFVPDTGKLEYFTEEDLTKIYSTIDSAESARELDSNLFYALSEVFDKYNVNGDKPGMLLAPEFLSDNPRSISITSGGCKTDLLEGIGLTPIKKDDMPLLKTFAKIFVEETAKYPLSWWEKAVPPFVVFVKALRVNGEIVGGVEHGAIVFNITQAESRSVAAETIHHELMHWLDHSTRSRTDPAWPGLPETYFGEYNLDSDYNSEFHPEEGFITGYAKTNSMEDKAEIYSLMFNREGYVILNDLGRTDALLKKKMDYIKNFIKSRVTQMDEDYFENLRD